MAASPSRPPKLESMPSFTTLETTATTKADTILEVCVHLGRNLVSKDSNGLSDPYLKVFLLDKHGKAIKKSLIKSKIVKETLNPAFVDAHYEYSSLPSGTSGVCVEVWDWDRWTADDFMGQLIFPIGSDAFDLDTAWHEVKSRAKKRDRVSGDLLLQVRFNPAGLTPMVPKPTVKVEDLLRQLIDSLSRATDADEKNQLEATIDQLQKALADHKKSGAKGDLRVAMDSSAAGPDPLDSDEFEDLDDESVPETETADCPICYETFPQRTMRDYDCGHKYCKSCLSSDIITHISSGEVKSLKCPHPDCEATPNDYHVRAYAGREWYIKRTQFLALQSLRENPNARWCPDAACSAPIVVDPNTLPESNEVTCVSCRKPFCFVCRHAGHQPSPCSDVKEGDDDLALKLYLNRQATKTKQCPRCHTGIEKNEGCNHMTCANCKHQWCWLCLGDCPDAPAHFNRPGPCNGHWFTQASTVEEAAQIESARVDYRQRHPIKTGLRRAGGIVATTVIVAGVVIIAVPVVVLAVAAGVLFSVFT